MTQAQIIKRLRKIKNLLGSFEPEDHEIAVEQIMPDKIIGKSEYYFDVEISRKKINNKNFKIGEIIKAKY